jgi:hypothetical protein
MTVFNYINAQSKYDKVQPEVKELVADLIEHVVEFIQKKAAEQTREIIQETLPSKEQQRETIEFIALNTLYKPKSEKRMRAVIRSYLSEVQDPQTHDCTAAKDDSFHSTQEIRELILKHLDAIRADALFSQREFRLVHIIEYLKVRAPRRMGDADPRWARQVHNALATWDPAACPIVRGSTKGYYKLRDLA